MKTGFLPWILMYVADVEILDAPMFISRLCGNKKSQNKPYKCQQCGKSYRQNYNLRRHMKLECGLMGQFACEYCDYVSKRRNELQHHIFRKHSSFPSFCDKIFGKSVENT